MTVTIDENSFVYETPFEFLSEYKKMCKMVVTNFDVKSKFSSIQILQKCNLVHVKHNKYFTPVDGDGNLLFTESLIRYKDEGDLLFFISQLIELNADIAK